MKNIYVTEFNNNRVQVFDSEGFPLFMFGSSGSGPGQFDFPLGIAVDNMKNIYVADASNNRVQVFDSEGFPLFMFGSSGDGAGQFASNNGIAVDGMKNIYVTDSGNKRIQVFDSAGNFLFMFGWGVDDGANEFQICTSACQAGILGDGAGQFLNLVSIAVDNMKNIYVVDQINQRIQVFDSEGNFLFMFGWGVDDGANEFQICTSACQAGIFGDGAGQFDLPIGIAVDSMKNIYVADQTNDRIQVFFTPIVNIPIPTISEWGLIAMAGILGLVGFMVIRRRKVTA